MTKQLSKRQELREKRRKQDQNQRLIIIAVIVVGALLIAAALIYPSFKPVGAITEPEFVQRPQAEGNAMGDPNAPITLTEYSDFQCPYCARFWRDTESKLADAYVATGKVYFVYRSFGYFIGGPGGESGRAAEAAYCAGDQNKFWEMHDIIFSNQTGENVGDFTDRRLEAFAEKAGIPDMAAFKTCFNNGTHKARVDQDQVDGTQAGIQATPSFVLSYTDANGQPVSKLIEGAQAFESFQAEIEAALLAAGKK